MTGLTKRGKRSNNPKRQPTDAEPAAPPKEPYRPTEAEIARLEAHLARRKAKPRAPNVTVQHIPPGPAKITADHPNAKVWQVLLLDAFGTTEQPALDLLLGELMNATHPNATRPIPAEAVNGLVALMHGIGPRDEVEAMLAAQMIATHHAATVALRQLGNSDQIPQQDSNGNLATKLLRAFSAQVEALHRYRGKGQQKVVVEHVHVYPGGQAIVGAVNSHIPPGGGGTAEMEHQPHALEHAQGEALPSAIEAHREAVPVASG